VIVGGGIAGVAIAERLAREARRRGGSLAITLLERAPMLGMGTSGGLEGWFHTGALYCGFDHLRSIEVAVASRELLEQDYARDELFEARESCNLSTMGAGTRGPDDPPVRGAPWFHDHLDYLLPVREVRVRGGRHERMDRRLAAAAQAMGRCCTPSPADEANPRWSSLRLYPTLDRVMHSEQILADLSRCSWRGGVEYRFGVGVQGVIPGRGGAEHTVLASRAGRVERLRARHVVLAAGGSLARDESFGAFAGCGPRVERRRSVMVALSHPLAPRSIVHVGACADDDFSHLVHGEGPRAFAIIADSAWRGREPDQAADEHAARRLIEKAGVFFGADAIAKVRRSPFSCTKVEALADPTTGAGYAPWIGAADHESPICVLPGKFSFFPLCVGSVLNALVERRVFDLIRAGLGEWIGACPEVAPTSARRLALSEPTDQSPPGEPRVAAVSVCDRNLAVWRHDESSALL
jgi:2-polyprenyl-6-methoxyphenol hydroxylase-like FAD-dependent oxidoreductase